ncbi:MAG: hypothetical protein IKG82_14910 [Oscillospiraceae bacterium]|nr:hypothetical protein [Oscillospiraceae bacterium]
MRKLFWALTAAFGGYVLSGLVMRILRERFSVVIADRTALIVTIVTAAVLVLIALIAAGSRNLERARLTGYAKQACAPESDAKRLKTNLAAEIVWIIVLNLLFAAGLWYLRKQ